MASSFEPVKVDECSAKRVDIENKLNEHLISRPNRSELLNSNILKAFSEDPSMKKVMNNLIKQRLTKLDKKFSTRKSIQSLIRDGILKEEGIIKNDNNRRDMYRRISNHSLTKFLSERPTLNELVAANMVQDVMTWTKMEYNNGITPCKRNCHQMCISNNDNALYLIGGYNTGSFDVNLLKFDIHKNKWSRPLIAGCIPKERYSHSVVNINNNLLMFGGFNINNGQWLNDLYAVNIQQGIDTNSHSKSSSSMLVWYQPQTSGNAPSARASHATAVVGNKMYIFGGNNGTEIFNDFYCLDTMNMQWSKIKSSGISPSPRSNHSMSVVNDKYLIVFGGNDESNAFNDIHIYDIYCNKWYEPKINMSQCTAPSARCGHNAVCIGGDKLLIFGGGCDGKLLNDLHIFDMNTNRWIRPSDTGMTPTPRTGASITMTNKGDVIYIFGGGGNDTQSLLNDLYVLDSGYFSTDHQEINKLIYAAKPNYIKHNYKKKVEMDNNIGSDDILNITQQIDDIIGSVEHDIQAKIEQFREKEEGYMMILRSIEAERKKLTEGIKKDIAMLKVSVKASMQTFQQNCMTKMSGKQFVDVGITIYNQESEIKNNECARGNNYSLNKQIADVQQEMSVKYQYQCQRQKQSKSKGQHSIETQITSTTKPKTKRGRRRRRRRRKRNLSQQNTVNNQQLTGFFNNTNNNIPVCQQYQPYEQFLHAQYLPYIQPQISPFQYQYQFQFPANQHMILNQNAINYAHANNLYKVNIS